MESERFNKTLKDTVDRSLNLLAKKNAHYAGEGTVDRLAGMKKVAAIRGVSIYDAIGGMMAKHTSSIYDLIDKPDSPIEVWEEKITDHINYLLFLEAAVREEFCSEEKDDLQDYLDKILAVRLKSEKSASTTKFYGRQGSEIKDAWIDDVQTIKDGVDISTLFENTKKEENTMLSFEEDLKMLLNRHSAEAPSGTPDFILAKFITENLKTYNEAVGLRSQWRGEEIDRPTPKPTFDEVLGDFKSRNGGSHHSDGGVSFNGYTLESEEVPDVSMEAPTFNNMLPVKFDRNFATPEKIVEAFKSAGEAIRKSFNIDSEMESAEDNSVELAIHPDSKNFPGIAQETIREIHYPDLNLSEVYVVTFSFILGGWKAMVSTTVEDNMYYEVTYNGAKEEAYVDAYKKVNNRVVKYVW